LIEQKAISKSRASSILAQHVLKAKGKNGEVELKVKLAGYNQDVLDKAGVQNPVSF